MKKELPLKIARLALNIDVFRVCLIDDCTEDCDAPLMELAVNTLSLRQAFNYDVTTSLQSALLDKSGSAHFKLTGDYYNRYTRAHLIGTVYVCRVGCGMCTNKNKE